MLVVDAIELLKNRYRRRRRVGTPRARTLSSRTRFPTQAALARAGRARPIVEVINDDADLRDLILRLLHVDPAQRLDPRRMAAHPYVDRHYPESLRHPVSEVRPEAVATS